ncbi:Hypothetical_protein [Hexamita inflata]|uniref:Hypothetical_protein n=1 Tax=Hexamita inflata TaxID=28002 RepID=A0AA86NIX4_9EUKA|nr:Hypothetical protein HINF_LOCUS7519 [Hexamita inflata]
MQQQLIQQIQQQLELIKTEKYSHGKKCIKQIETVHKDIASLQNEIKQCTLNIKHQQQYITQYNEQIANIQGKLDQSRNIEEEVKQQIVKYTNQANSSDQILINKINQFNQEIESCNVQIARLKQVNIIKKQNAQKLKRNILSLQNQIDQQTTINDETFESITVELSQQYDQVQTQISNNNALISDLKQKIQNSADLLRPLLNQVQDAESKISLTLQEIQIEKTRNGVEITVSVEKSDLAHFQKQKLQTLAAHQLVHNANLRITALQNEIDFQKKQIAFFQLNREQQIQYVHQLENQVQTQNEQLSSLNNQKQMSFTNSIEFAKLELKNVSQKINEIKINEELIPFLEEIKQTETEIDNFEKRNKKLKQKIVFNDVQALVLRENYRIK